MEARHAWGLWPRVRLVRSRSFMVTVRIATRVPPQKDHSPTSEISAVGRVSKASCTGLHTSPCTEPHSDAARLWSPPPLLGTSRWPGDC